MEAHNDDVVYDDVVDGVVVYDVVVYDVVVYDMVAYDVVDGGVVGDVVVYGVVVYDMLDDVAYDAVVYGVVVYDMLDSVKANGELVCVYNLVLYLSHQGTTIQYHPAMFLYPTSLRQLMMQDQGISSNLIFILVPIYTVFLSKMFHTIRYEQNMSYLHSFSNLDA